MIPPPCSLFLASGNAHKIAELTALLGSLLGIGVCRIITPNDFPNIAEPEETGATFEENALLKARYWASISEMLALADDSGLVVDALDGRPGVLSARYAPTVEERNRRVLDEMAAILDPLRTARFVCVAALADPAGGSLLRRGEVLGRIARAPRGAAGFGYDPIFELAETGFTGRTMAELTSAEKNIISHRARALAALAEILPPSLAAGLVLESAALGRKT